jgi:hypothetical protein
MLVQSAHLTEAMQLLQGMLSPLTLVISNSCSCSLQASSLTGVLLLQKMKAGKTVMKDIFYDSLQVWLMHFPDNLLAVNQLHWQQCRALEELLQRLEYCRL